MKLSRNFGLKKKYKLGVVFLFASLFSFAQNLVPNGNLDAVTFCPNSLSQIFFIQSWSWPTNHNGTPDAFNSCYSGLGTGVDVPNNYYGYQPALSGTGYAGLVPFSAQEYREYISIPLSIPLVAGEGYNVGFHVNRANNGNCSIDALGAHLSVGGISGVGNSEFLPFVPQIENPAGNLLSDTVNWSLISGVFVASGGESHLTIGNFKSDLNTLVQYTGGGAWEGYYYVDDVFVIPITLHISGNNTICQGQSVTLQAYGDSLYTWVDSLAPTTILSNNATISLSPLVTTTYTVFSLTDTASFTVNVNTPTQIDLGNDTTLCEGESVLLNASFPNATYNWQDGSTDSTFLVTQSGTYSVTRVENNCPVYDTILVNVLSPSIVDLGNDSTLCVGATLPLDVTLANATYLWQDGSIDSSIIISQAGTYLVQVMNSWGCTNADTVQIGYYSPFAVNLGPDLFLCPSNTVTLDATTTDTNVTYLWQDGSTSVQFQLAQAGQYFVDVTNQCETVSDTVNVNFEIHPGEYLGNDSIACEGINVALNVNILNSQTQWQDQSISNTFVVSSPGTYNAMTITQNNCFYSDEITIDFLEAPQINLGPDFRICDIKNAYLENLLGEYEGDYIWNTGSTDYQLPIDTAGVYSVEMFNPCGIATDTVEIGEKGCNCFVYLPNSLTPNGDEFNGFFGAKYDCFFTEFNLKIYNRWGELVWESNDPDVHWDGTYRTRKVNEGVYIYQLKYSSEFVRGETLTGHVSVLR